MSLQAAVHQKKRKGEISLLANKHLQGLRFGLSTYWTFGTLKKSEIGLGFSLGTYKGASTLPYYTAPANIVSGKQGLPSYFTKSVSNNIDTLMLNKTQTTSLNLMLQVQRNFLTHYFIQAQADLIGFSFGGEKQGLLSYGDDPVYSSVNTKARVTTMNLLLPSKHAYGTVASGVSIGYTHRTAWQLAVGAMLLYTEYMVQSPVNYINTQNVNVNTNRYRSRSCLFSISFALKR
jgi:hypothetical protein